MDFRALDKKWNDIWEKSKAYKFDKKALEKKYYVLEMFSYPSASNLHLGHWYNYAPSDSFARFKKMQGYNVFQPMGFDSFGLPAENFAIKTGVHPHDSTMKNIATMEKQLKAMGAMFDWDNEINTCSPDYYKWTQWLFLQLYKKGLAYQKLALVNFCSSCNTVIANEQVVNGECERCGTVIKRKEMTQWFFKITHYADELLQMLDNLDWPEKTKTMQRNWIGKSIGGEIDFALENGETIKVFTTRADTLCGVSYVVLAPEHKLVDKITANEHKKAVEAYKEETAKSSDIDRLSSVKEKTGVFTGAYCFNPLTNEKVPVYIADYCLVTYGTGAVMAVPAHDTRDFDFAKKYNLPIKRVIKSSNGENDELPFIEYGVLVNSGKFDNLQSEKAVGAILEDLKAKNKGTAKVNYRLRDWSVSRQRFWGAPIPIIYCPECGTVEVPEKDLPVTLPYNVNFTPDGSSPLKKCEEFINVKCPKCGQPAKRDADTLDTFVCSSWYFLRYPDSKNDKNAWDTDFINKMLPVDKYIGGAEHACMHLLYARFMTKALRDMGFVNFDEPFTSLVHQGLILGADGNKMSKSKGNVVNPDTYIAEHGSDVFRLYLLFCFSYIEGGPWSDDGIKAVNKFLERFERIVTKTAQSEEKDFTDNFGENEKELEYALHYAIKNVTENLEIFSFNTAVARIMELVNALYKYDALEQKNMSLLKSVVYDLIKLIAPLVPHIAEELNLLFNNKQSIFDRNYPVFNQTKLIKAEIELAVQINSKLKSKIVVPTNATEEQIKAIALKDAKMIEALGNANIKKIILIKDKLINFVC